MAFSILEARTCPQINLKVSLDQSEADCRAQHGCEQRHCPMARDFRPERIDLLLEATRVLDR